MSTEAGGVGIGARLRAARERRGLTVLQAAEKLHVDARVLEALEAENFAPLGADVYVRGHLRRYAELLGESVSQLQDLYASAGPAARPDLTRIPRAQHAPRATRWQMPALVTIVALALAGLLWWILTLPRATPRPVVTAAHSVAAGEEVTSSEQPAPQAAAGGTLISAAAQVPGTGGAASGGADVQLSVKLSDASWVLISDVHGRHLLNGLLPAESARTVSGAAPLTVVLGNAAAVTLALNGRPLTVGGFVRRRGDAHIVISGTGAVSPATAAPDHGE
jgi:cytoskeleton protein RodZ